MKKINEQLDMFAGSEDVYKDAVENMKSVRKLAAERLKEREKAAKDLEKATATEKVRLQGTKEPKLPKNHYTERLDVVNRKELAKLVESAKKEGKKFKVSRSLKEGFRYTLMLEGKLEEARGKGKGQKLDKYFKLVNRLHKDKLTKGEVAEINKAIDEVKSFEPAGEWEEKDKKNLLDQLTMVLDVVDVPIKEEFERKNLINLPQSVQDALYDWVETGADAHLLSKEGDNFIFDFETYNKFLEVCDSPESYWENWVDVDKYEPFRPKDLLKTLVEHYGAKEEDIKGISDTEVKEAALFVETEVTEEYRRKYASKDLENLKESKQLKEDYNNALKDIDTKLRQFFGDTYNDFEVHVEEITDDGETLLELQVDAVDDNGDSALPVNAWLSPEGKILEISYSIDDNDVTLIYQDGVNESKSLKEGRKEDKVRQRFADEFSIDELVGKSMEEVRKFIYELWNRTRKDIDNQTYDLIVDKIANDERIDKEIRQELAKETKHLPKYHKKDKKLKEDRYSPETHKFKVVYGDSEDYLDTSYFNTEGEAEEYASQKFNSGYEIVEIHNIETDEVKKLDDLEQLKEGDIKESLDDVKESTEFKVKVIHGDIPVEDNPWEEFTIKETSREEAEKLINNAEMYVEEDIPGAFYTIVIKSGDKVLHKITQLTGDSVEDFDYLIDDLLSLVIEDDVVESSVENATPKLEEALKIITELSDFEPWSGATDTWDKIINAGYEQELEDLLEERYPEGITITELNDLLWHDGEDLLDRLGIEDTEELDLPTEVTTTVEEIGYGKQEIEENDEIVSDWLSDEYGFTHYGFNYYVNDDNEVIITDIEWDTSESYYKNSKRDKLFEDFVKNDILSSDDAEYIKDSTSWVTNPDRLVVELLDEMINAGASLNAVVPILKEHGLDTDRIIADGAREKADSIDIANAPVDYSLDDDISVEPPVDFEATDNGDLEVDGEFEWVDDEYGWDFEENLVPVDEDANPLSHKNLSVLWDKYHDEDKVIEELEKLGLDIDRGDLQGVVEAFVLMLDEEPQDIPESKPLKEDLQRKPLKEQKGKYNIIASVSGLQESVIKRTDNLTEALNFVQAVEDKYLYALVVEGITGRIITDFPEE